jgi:hypothetical protein
MTETTPALFAMPASGGKPVIAAFDGGAQTSDIGVALLAAVERRLGFIDRLAELVPDRRDPARVTHRVGDMLRARVLAIAAGYEDVADLDALRRDPAFLMALGREPETGQGLCSKPTMHRLENAPDKAAGRAMFRAMVDWFCMSFPSPPGTLTLDIDETPDAVHGGSQLALFNGHYGMTCHLPIHIYHVETGRPVAVLLRPGKPPSGRELRAIIRVVMRRLRRAWPQTTVTWRGDARYATPETMAYLEVKGCGYLFGLPANRRIDALFAAPADALKASRAVGPDGGILRDHAEARYAAASWTDPRGGAIERRVVARMEASPHGYDVRYVVTNLSTPPAVLYDSLYCRRGEKENLIKLHKVQLASDRTSCISSLANQFRLVLHTIAYWIMIELRRLVAATRPERRASFNTIRLRLIKIAARIQQMKTRIRVHLPSDHPAAELFRSLSIRLAGP